MGINRNARNVGMKRKPDKATYIMFSSLVLSLFAGRIRSDIETTTPSRSSALSTVSASTLTSTSDQHEDNEAASTRISNSHKDAPTSSNLDLDLSSGTSNKMTPTESFIVQTTGNRETEEASTEQTKSGGKTTTSRPTEEPISRRKKERRGEGSVTTSVQSGVETRGESKETATTVEYSTSSYSTYSSGSNYFTYHFFEVTDSTAVELPDGLCEEEKGFQDLESDKSYSVYKVNLTHANNDEGSKLEVKCELRGRFSGDKCESWITSSLGNLSVEVNGEIQDTQFTRSYSPEDKIVTFTGILHFETHNKGLFSCVHQLPSGARLVSTNTTIYTVYELHHYSITPTHQELEVDVGEWFTLTCHTDSIRGLQGLKWGVTSEDRTLTLHSYETTTIGLTYQIQEVEQDLFSVLNITKANLGNSVSEEDYIFFCTESYTYHSNQTKSQVKVRVRARKEHVWELAAGVGLSSLVLLIILTISYKQWRDRRRKCLSQVSLLFMY